MGVRTSFSHREWQVGITFSLAACPRATHQGKIVYWAGINLDIQHRKESEQQLLQLVESLESRVSQRTLELQNATEKLRELTGTLLQTQDEERRRIARELHDGVGQLVVAMSMTLSNIVGEKEKLSPAAQQTLDQSLALIDQASAKFAPCPTFSTRLSWMKSAWIPRCAGTSRAFRKEARSPCAPRWPPASPTTCPASWLFRSSASFRNR